MPAIARQLTGLFPSEHTFGLAKDTMPNGGLKTLLCDLIA
jgi:hypothetical protein